MSSPYIPDDADMTLIEEMATALACTVVVVTAEDGRVRVAYSTHAPAPVLATRAS